MSYIKALAYLFICITFYASGMNQSNSALPNQNSQESNNRKLFQYRLALLNLQLHDNSKPFKEIQMYALAHAGEESKKMLSFCENFTNEFTQKACELNSAKQALDYYRSHKQECLAKLLQFHKQVKDKLAQESPRKQ